MLKVLFEDEILRGNKPISIVQTLRPDHERCLCNAFKNDPLLQWQSADVDRLAWVMRYTLLYCISYGSVLEIVADGTVRGVMCVLPSGVDTSMHSVEVIKVLAERGDFPPKDELASSRSSASATILKEVHDGVVPITVPHLHLWMIGCETGKGYGTALMNVLCGVAEKLNALIYLETNSAGLLAFYARWSFGCARHFYVEYDHGKLDSTLYAMVREPKRHMDLRLSLSQPQGSNFEPLLPLRLEQMAQNWGSRIALVEVDSAATTTTMTYAQLWRQSTSLCVRLQRLFGVSLGTRVAILCPSSINYVVSVVAVLLSGGTYVPIEPKLPASRIAFILEDCKPAVVLTSDAGSVPASWPQMQPSLQDSEQVFLGPAPVSNHDVAYIVYTSGSTGNPKGCMVPHAGIANTLSRLQEIICLTEEDVTLHFYGVGFDGCVINTLLPLLAGAQLFLKNEQAWMRQLHGVTVAFLTPSAWQALDDELVHCWRSIVVGGEALKQSDVARLQKHQRCYNIYGPTECSVVSSVGVLCAQDAPCIHIGKAIGGMAYSVVRPGSTEAVAFGCVGELFISGVGVALGYLNLAEKTRACFVSGGYLSGDLCRFLPNGDMLYLGRADGAQVKIRGHRLELGEVQSALEHFPGVKGAVVFKVEGRGGDSLRAFVVCEPHDVADEKQLKDHLRGHLPWYGIPDTIQVLSEFRLTPNGKVDMAYLKSLPAMSPSDSNNTDHDNSTTATTGNSPAERAVLQVLGEVLHIQRPIGVHERFFELGMNSLSAMQFSFALEKRGLPFNDLHAILSLQSVRALTSSAAHSQASEDLAVTLFDDGGEACDHAVILLHGSNGSLGYLRALVARIKRRGAAVYGLHCIGRTPSVRDVRDLCKLYSKSLYQAWDAHPKRTCSIVSSEMGNIYALELSKVLGGKILVTRVVLTGHHWLTTSSTDDVDAILNLVATMMPTIDLVWAQHALSRLPNQEDRVAWVLALQDVWLTPAIVHQQIETWRSISKAVAKYIASLGEQEDAQWCDSTCWLVTGGHEDKEAFHSPTALQDIPLLYLSGAGHWATLVRDGAASVVGALFEGATDAATLLLSSGLSSSYRFDDDLRASILGAGGPAKSDPPLHTSDPLEEELLTRAEWLLNDAETLSLGMPLLPLGQRRSATLDSLADGSLVLLSGASGFLGPFILRALLKDSPHVRIVCIVRAKDKQAAFERVLKSLQDIDYHQDEQELRSRLSCLAGNLTLPRLGLTPAEWVDLCERVSFVVANGALVNHVLEYAQLRDANVLGVVQLLRLCGAGQPKRLVYVSTVGVIPPHCATLESPTISTAIDVSMESGYCQSKWVAEQLVMRATRQHGLDATIVRPAMIGWSVESGACSDGDWVVGSVKASQLAQCVPVTEQLISLAPVEWVAQGVLAPLKWTAFETGYVMHICGPPCRYADMFTALCKVHPAGLVVSVSFPEWLRGLSRCSQEDPSCHRIMAAPLMILGAMTDFPAHRTFDMSRARIVWGPCATTPPPMDATYFDKLVGFLQRQ